MRLKEDEKLLPIYLIVSFQAVAGESLMCKNNSIINVMLGGSLYGC